MGYLLIIKKSLTVDPVATLVCPAALAGTTPISILALSALTRAMSQSHLLCYLRRTQASSTFQFLPRLKQRISCNLLLDLEQPLSQSTRYAY